MSDCSRNTLSVAIMLVLWAPIARAEDIWAAGHSLPDWQKIDRLQSYPFPRAEPVPDFDALCQDKEPLVRTAACMAIGREADPRRVALLKPLLKDESPVVREFALEALLQLESPAIKGPLLEVLGTWETVRPELLALRDSSRGLERLGLPGWLVDSNTSLADRQRWLAEFDADEWNITFKVPDQEQAGRTTIWATIPVCEFDSTESLRLRVRIARRGGKQPETVYLEEDASLSELRFKDHARLRVTPAADPSARGIEVEAPPDGAVECDLVAKVADGKLLPGVYLLSVNRADWPLLVRVRRSRQTEREIHDLLSKSNDSAAIKRLGEERVQAAAPVLLGGFVANAGRNNFDRARALARIGDPRAVPVMLQFPQMNGLDFGGDTFLTLRSFGEVGDPEYERYILNWKEHVGGEAAQALRMSLKLLGPRGSAEVDRATLDLVRTLSESITNDLESPNFDRLTAFRAALPTVAQTHPDEAEAALWALRDRPIALGLVLDEFRRAARTAWAAGLIGRLYQRADEPGQEATREALLRSALRQVPDQVLASKVPLASAAEAVQVAMFAPRDPATLENSIERLEAFVRRDPSPAVKLALAKLHFHRDSIDRCEPLFFEVLNNVGAADYEAITAHYYLGEIEAGRGRWATTKKHYEAALALMKPNVGYYPGGDQIRRKIDELPLMPETQGAEIRRQRMTSFVEDNGYVELADHCAFFLDRSRRLRRWDLRTASETSFGVMPNPVRQLVPLDRQRVLVLFKDGTSRMYREGKRKPEWAGPKAIPHWSHLTTSKSVITLADDSGVLYAISPDDGKTLWTSRCEVRNEPDPPAAAPLVEADPFAEDPFAGGLVLRPITGYEHRTSSRNVCQVGPLLLVPDKPLDSRRFRGLRLKDGSEAFTFEVDFPVIELAADGEFALLAGSQGQLTAASLRDGKLLWNMQITDAVTDNEYDLTMGWNALGKSAYLAVKDRLWAIDPASGRTQWTWTWMPAGNQPRKASESGPSSRLLPLSDDVVWLVDWTAPPRPGRGHETFTDIVLLSAAGNALAHHTSPLSAARKSVVAPQAIVDGGTLFVRLDQDWETWRLPRAP